MSKIKQFSFLVGFALFLVIGQNVLSAQVSIPPTKGTSTFVPKNFSQQQAILIQGSGDPIIAGYQIQEFNNGCTRTCTGDWSGTGPYYCDGIAGPLNCAEGMGNTLLRQMNLIGQYFNSDGTIKSK